MADSDSGREPILLDRELLSGEAAYTHTHNGRGSTNGTDRRSSQRGYGASEPTRTNLVPLHSSPTDGEQRVKDKKTLKREIRERIADSVDVDAQIVPPTAQNVYRTTDAPVVALDAPNSKGLGHSKSNLSGTAFFRYWLWRCRSTQTDWSTHPIRQFDPAAPVYFAESLTETQE